MLTNNKNVVMAIFGYCKNLPQINAILKLSKVNTLSKNVYGKVMVRGLTTYRETFKFDELQITVAEPTQRKAKPDPNALSFGKEFSDHMFEVEWNSDNGWGVPRICQLHNLILHPASKVLHYAQELFEGMKAFRLVNGKVSLFRPKHNMRRMLSTSERASLPLFDGDEFLKCLKKLVSIDQEWVPNSHLSSLYVRPTFIGIESSLGVTSANKALLYIICSPVGPYFSSGVREPVSLLADPQYVRAWPGGVGDKKMGSNYAPTIYVQKQASNRDIQQVLWLYGEDHQLTEIGAMNVFIFLINENGEKELVTPPLNGIILPGVVRCSLLELAREWNEFKVSERIITMKEVVRASNENRLLEVFGSGTACVVCPVKSIVYMGMEVKVPSSSKDLVNHRLFDALTDIQYGRTPSAWMEAVD